MKHLLAALFMGLLWGLTVCLTVLEALLTWLWLRGTLYVMRYGAVENPYAAEDAEIAGCCAVILLPLVLAALVWAGYRIILYKNRAKARSKR